LKEAEIFIKDIIAEGKYFYYEDNVFMAEKLFVVNSIIRWVVSRSKSGEFDSSQVRNYLNAVASYLDGKIDVFWENGALYVQKLK
tara:strand:- start:896 stop:1150 length:255 start_codon:yes stop_codon:yes gene_type:complete